MASKSNPADEPVNFDDLLGLTADDGPAVSENDDVEELLGEHDPEITSGETLAETPEQRRIRELQAELSKPLPTYRDDVEVPETPEQRQIKDLEDQLARRASVAVEAAPTQYAAPARGETILIHVLIDGFLALGEVWYRGQELEFEVGGRAYEQTKNRQGKSWVDLAGDIPGQYARWGKQYLGVGPFIGRPDEKFEDAVAVADQRRGRAVPLVRG